MQRQRLLWAEKPRPCEDLARIVAIVHAGARTDQEVSVRPPARSRVAHPIPHALALLSRPIAPPLQPPRA